MKVTLLISNVGSFIFFLPKTLQLYMITARVTEKEYSSSTVTSKLNYSTDKLHKVM